MKPPGGKKNISNLRHGVTLIFFSLLLILDVIFFFPVVSSAAEEKKARRPKISLVLGGGGAKGAAHIGVLKVLEDRLGKIRYFQDSVNAHYGPIMKHVSSSESRRLVS